MNDVIKQRGCFYNNTICYIDTESLSIQKKNWSDLVDNGFVGKSLGSGKMIMAIRVHFLPGF